MIRAWIAAVVVSLSFAASQMHAGTVIINDPVEPDGTWTLIDGGWGVSGQMGFNASAGTFYWGSSWQEPATVGIEKSFSGITATPGVYTLTMDTMCPAGSPYNPVPLGDFSEFGLTGISPTEETVISAPTPTAGLLSWTRWTLQYEVPLGSSDLGDTLGFEAVYQHTDHTYYSVMLDNLQVAFQPVPEPSTFALLGIGVISLLGFAWRRRVASGR